MKRFLGDYEYPIGSRCVSIGIAFHGKWRRHEVRLYEVQLLADGKRAAWKKVGVLTQHRSHSLAKVAAEYSGYQHLPSVIHCTAVRSQNQVASDALEAIE